MKSTDLKSDESGADHGLELLSYLDHCFERFAARPALRRETVVGEQLTYTELRERIEAAATALRAAGVAPGSRVALLSENRPEWVIALLAAFRAGATVVPLDTKLTNSEIAVLLGHAEPHVILASRVQCDRLRDASRSPGLDRVLVIDEELRTGARAAWVRRDPAETALVIYTSGTTGDPKGVEITFANLLHQVRAVDRAIGPQGRERFLSVLPLCHLYELICGLLVPLSRGAVVSYSASETVMPSELTRIMKMRRITSLVGVPLLYRALARGIDLELRRAPAFARWIVAVAGALALRLPFPRVKRLLHTPILRGFGGRLRQLYSGGAALEVGVGRRFESMGLRVFEGYGLSETSPVIATNTPGAYRLGSVGRPLPGVEVKISADGEIHTRGPNVMRGYVDRLDLTAAVLGHDGWLRTGDLGHLDADGYLYVTGRAKEVIVLGGGKKVYPDEVELALAQHPAFTEVCVLGIPGRHGHDEVCAVVVPAASALTDEVIAAAEADVAHALAGIAAYKRPTRVLVRREAIPRTTTRKAKRTALLAWVGQLDVQKEAA